MLYSRDVGVTKATPTAPTVVWNDQFDIPPRQEVRAAAQAVLGSGDLDQPLTTSGFEIIP